MIVKILKGGGDFRATIGYLLAKERGVDPEVLDLGGGLVYRSPDDLALQCEQTAARRTDCEKPVYHCVFSWHQNDRPSPDQLRSVVDGALKRLGVDDRNHQVLAVAHRETDEHHVHLVVNRVGADETLWFKHRDAQALQAYRREVDQAHGWVVPDGRGAERQIDQALTEQPSPQYIRGLKREAHAAVASAIAACDGTLEGFVTTCQEQGRILPTLSYNQAGFNGASFVLLQQPDEAVERPLRDQHPDAPVAPVTFKGSQIGWPKRTLEAGLFARREELALADRGVPRSPARRGMAISRGVAAAGHLHRARRHRGPRPAKADRRTTMPPLLGAVRSRRRLRLPPLPDLTTTARRLDGLMDDELRIEGGRNLDHPLPPLSRRGPSRP